MAEAWKQMEETAMAAALSSEERGEPDEMDETSGDDEASGSNNDTQRR